MLLPTPDALPYEPVPARTVRTYRPGLWFEGIARHPDGGLLLAGSAGLDHATGSMAQVRGEVIHRAPDGAERTVVGPLVGSTAGVTAVAPEGTFFMAVTGAERGLWRIEPDGAARLLAATPAGSWPNGVCFTPAGAAGPVLVADSALGVVWRVDPESGGLAVAFEGDELRARPGAIAPGANGIQRFGEHVYVTSSDAGTLLRFEVDAEGGLHDPVAVVTGVPADDFAVAADGTFYLTTHIFDTVVRVDPDGRRAVIAGAEEGVTGATDCVLEQHADGRRVLHVVTDGGGLVSGDREAAGALVALEVGTA